MPRPALLIKSMAGSTSLPHNITGLSCSGSDPDISSDPGVDAAPCLTAQKATACATFACLGISRGTLLLA